MDNSKLAATIFNKYASEYSEKYMDVSLYHDSFDVFCSEIKKGAASVLELACGPGNITKYLLHKRPDLNIHGVDLAPNMIALAQKNNPAGKFEVMDCRQINTLNTSYDAIMCGFCLPYLTKTEALQLISDCGALLNPGGVIYISTMEDYHDKSGFKKGSKGDEIFMNYHEAPYLINALEETGFKLILVDRKNSMSNNEPVVDLVLVAKK